MSGMNRAIKEGATLLSYGILVRAMSLPIVGMIVSVGLCIYVLGKLPSGVALESALLVRERSARVRQGKDIDPLLSHLLGGVYNVESKMSNCGTGFEA